MNKLISKITLLSSIILLGGCANTESISHQDPAGCSANNVNIMIELDQSTSTPELKDKAQRVVCVNSGNTVTWHRNNADGSNDFTIFFKDSAVEIPASNGKATYTAPKVTIINAFDYGVKMPDATNDLDPIIIIIPTIGQH